MASSCCLLQLCAPSVSWNTSSADVTAASSWSKRDSCQGTTINKIATHFQPCTHHSRSQKQSIPASLNIRSTAGAVMQASLAGRLGGAEKGGTGLLEKPGLDQSQERGGPATESGGEMGRLIDRRRTRGGDRYRVLLLDHEKHSEGYVAKVLPTVVPSVTAEDARRVFHESRELGAGLVTLAIKEHAEFYAQKMAMKGLRSTIEPDGSVL